MKKLNLKSQLLLGALLLGASAAGAHHAANLPKASDTLYNWTRVGGMEQSGETDPLPSASRDTAIQNYGCENGSETCAIGVNPADQNDILELKFD